MKALILAGGLGSRLQEVTNSIPKPMVQIGGYPILWHIMKYYSNFGIDDFSVALGYHSNIIKDYFANLSYYQNSVHVDMRNNIITKLSKNQEQWTIDLVETGLHNQTGSRIAQMKSYSKGETFLVTYGDGLSDINIHDLIKFHKSHGKIATVSAVIPPSKFGALEINSDSLVVNFTEKPNEKIPSISGGYFVFEQEVFDYLSEDKNCILEHDPLQNLAKDCQLMAYQHKGFWQCMDTLKDINLLCHLWEENKAPWKCWD